MPGTRTKKKQGGLGKTLLKARNKKKEKVLSDRHVQDHEDELLSEKSPIHHMVHKGRGKLESIIEQNDLSEFLMNAKIQQKKFEAETITFIVKDEPKEYKVVERKARNNEENDDEEDDEDIDEEEEENDVGGVLVLQERSLEEIQERVKELQNVQLPIPRRPKWNKTMTKKELLEIEGESFLEWRRDLAVMEDEHDAILTPFEKNIEVWRQLWRVVERSDIVVQIVDARNPFLFRNEDLEAYVKEIDSNKENFLLLNKADLLTKRQRFKWANYFKKKGINFIFFSAKNESLMINQTQKSKEELLKEQQEELDSFDITNYKNPQEDDWTYIFSRRELLFFFKSLMKKFDPHNKLSDIGRVVVGMVGYPNVGKSSLVNVLCGKKKVAVGSTPGKTKHFQTLPIGENVMLADCPGLVFPSIRTTKEEMICDGILSSDQMRDYRPAISLICSRIPRRTFELTYGITFPKIVGKVRKTFVTVENLLRTFCKAKSIMSQSGVPNYPQAARRILKDYTDGKILYCHPPPEEFEEEEVPTNVNLDEEEQVLVVEDEQELAEDEEYFTESDEEIDEEEFEGGLSGDEEEEEDDENISDAESDEMELDGEVDDFNLVNVHTQALERKKENIIKKKGYDPFELDENTVLEYNDEQEQAQQPKNLEELMDGLTEKQKRRKMTYLKNIHPLDVNHFVMSGKSCTSFNR
ncbi:hypothetical protein ABK040_003168 [Willaertia magna]